MRLVIASLSAAAALLAVACSGEAAPGSPEWCKNTPVDQQIEQPDAMAKCLDGAAS
jgi:hypothetical protein